MSIMQFFFVIIDLMIEISHQLYTNMENFPNLVGARWL